MADPHTRGDVEGLFDAVRAGRIADVRTRLAGRPSLLSAFDPNESCCRGTPLNVAVEQGDREMVDALLEAGADIDRKSDWWAGGFAPIHSVPRRLRPSLTTYLIQRGATVDVQAASEHGMLDRLTRLLDEVPDRVNQPGGDGGRPLHFAANVEVAELLLDRGALLDPHDVDHWSTPAQWAVRDRPEVSHYLLAKGAGGDVFMYAAIDARVRIERALDDDPTAARAVFGRAFFPSPGSRGGHIYHFLLGQYGATVLHVAAAVGRTDVAAMLLDAGADPDARGGYDDATSLHVAAWNDHPDMAELLVARGATIDIPSGSLHGTPPLGWALINGKHRAVERLLHLGAEMRPEYRQLLDKGLEGELGVSSATRSDVERIGRVLDDFDRNP